VFVQESLKSFAQVIKSPLSLFIFFLVSHAEAAKLFPQMKGCGGAAMRPMLGSSEAKLQPPNDSDGRSDGHIGFYCP